jgi:hypothetical protein
MAKKEKDNSGWIEFILDILEEILEAIIDIFD